MGEHQYGPFGQKPLRIKGQACMWKREEGVMRDRRREEKRGVWMKGLVVRYGGG